MQFTAQSIESIMNFDPASARATPTFLFKDEKTYEIIFDIRTNFQVYLNCCLIVREISNYIKYEISDKIIKNRNLNFTYHIARIVTSIITSKAYYERKQLALFNVKAINKEIIENAIAILNQLIGEYKNNNPDENIINIAKSKKFSNTLNEELNKII